MVAIDTDYNRILYMEGGKEKMKFKENYLLWGAIALFIIIILQPQSGLFATVNIPEVYPCPAESLTESPCEGAVWIDTPKCYWDISGCEDYCASDADCKVMVDAPNDCTLFFKPHQEIQIGYCDRSFCNWQQIPTAERDCTATELFLQKYKWVLLGLLIFIVAYIAFEKDWKGKKRGLF